MSITTIESIGMTVGDIDRSIDFYTTVLAFTKTGDRFDRQFLVRDPDGHTIRLVDP